MTSTEGLTRGEPFWMRGMPPAFRASWPQLSAGRRLALRRNALRMTQRQLARRLGTVQGHVSDAEREVPLRHSSALLERISRALEELEAEYVAQQRESQGT